MRLPTDCSHNPQHLVKPLHDCRQCGGTGRVAFDNGEYPAGSNACCCTCAVCREGDTLPGFDEFSVEREHAEWKRYEARMVNQAIRSRRSSR